VVCIRYRPQLRRHSERANANLRLSVKKDRQYRIDRAEEAGSVRTWSLDDATHVVVDSGVHWDKIKSKLEPCSTLDQLTVVNDTFFPSCLEGKLLYDHDQKRYEVPGFAEAMLARKSSDSPPPPPDTAEQLLPASTFRELPPIKPAKRDLKKSAAAAETPPPSQASSGPSSITNVQPVLTQAPSSVHQDPKQGKLVILSEETYNDELSECIAEELQSKDLPLDDDDDEANHSDETSTELDWDSDPGMRSEGEREEKRRKIAKGKHKAISSSEKYACNRGGTLDCSAGCPNARAIEVFQKMCHHYERLNDNPHKIISYRKAITTLKRLPYRLSTFEEAKALPNIGKNHARKIEEIHLTDRLRQLDFANDDPMNATLKLFVGIYGVGPTQASRWYAQGHRTLEDLKQNVHLSVNQRVGVDHYADLNTRIPRNEVEALGNFVKAAAAKMDEGLELIIGGSYRRGAPASGDIDFIVTRKSTTSSEQVLSPLMRLTETLEAEGFLVARLSSSKTEKGSKWHGCCVLPESHWVSDEPYRPIWRRIDFLAVPESQMGAALIYFTGNEIFNRSMRLLASRRLMRLNEKGLYRGRMRADGHVKVTEGELAESRDEKKIFEILGVRWREPHERWC
jgi:DNA polymerase IV